MTARMLSERAEHSYTATGEQKQTLGSAREGRPALPLLALGAAC
jgi:hypothetical protein